MNDAAALTNDRGRTDPGDAAPSLMSVTLAEAARRVSRGPAWLDALRRDAVRDLESRGFPKPNDEAWRFTPIRPVLRVPYAFAPERRLSAEPDAFAGFDAPKLVLVNGRLDGPVPNVPGVEIHRIAEVLATAPERLEPYLGKLVQPSDGFTSTNTALFDDGLFVVVRKGQKVGPLHLVIAGAASAEPTLATPRILVVSEPMSELRLVESRHHTGAGPHLDCAVTEVFVGNGASVEHTRIHVGDPGSSSVANTVVAQHEDSRFASRTFTFGGALARLDLRVLLRAEGAECALDGLYVARKGDLVDHQTTIEHEKARCTSRERYKGIIGGEGVAIFDGTVVVRPGASRTEAHQENRNLCLAPDAIVHTKPHLEIDTDDVKCSHGATVGRLDDNQLFYLRARGLDAEIARTILTYAFAREMVEPVADGALRRALERIIASLLPNGGAALELA